MRLYVRDIQEIGIMDENGKDTIVKAWDVFNTREDYAKSYLANYPQYFSKELIKPLKEKDIADEVELTADEIKEKITALGQEPKGNIHQLKKQLKELQEVTE